MPLKPVRIKGGGLAGSSAARRAMQLGADVELDERGQYPRHKVCGEFLSPEVQMPLEQLSIWSDFLACEPSRIRRMILNFGRHEKSGLLPEPAWGLSRYKLDRLLYPEAPPLTGEPDIIATGRSAAAEKGTRLFGFKAHYTGPQSDAVELYFFRGGYVGINAVEDGITNICGLGPESILKNLDDFLFTLEPLRERLSPLSQSMKWLYTGPLVFENKLNQQTGVYLAGDALSFVDPFTGSGMLCAMLTGVLAGECAAENIPVPEYLKQARQILGSAFSVSSFFRSVAKTNYAGLLASCIPAKLLFALTRPHPHEKVRRRA